MALFRSVLLVKLLPHAFLAAIWLLMWQWGRENQASDRSWIAPACFVLSPVVFSQLGRKPHDLIGAYLWALFAYLWMTRRTDGRRLWAAAACLTLMPGLRLINLAHCLAGTIALASRSRR